MGIPEEDLGPRWLRDYGGIEADITKLEEFAAALEAEVQQNYLPHAEYVKDDMYVRLPAPAAEFVELSTFLVKHDELARDATGYVHLHGEATYEAATVANEVSKQYRQSDAFAAARARDVEAALRGTTLDGAKPIEVPTGPTASGSEGANA
jgi:hypothetical protein